MRNFLSLRLKIPIPEISEIFSEWFVFIFWVREITSCNIRRFFKKIQSPEIRRPFLAKCKNFFNLRAWKIHFLKYKELFNPGTIKFHFLKNNTFFRGILFIFSRLGLKLHQVAICITNTWKQSLFYFFVNYFKWKWFNIFIILIEFLTQHKIQGNGYEYTQFRFDASALTYRLLFWDTK